MSRRHWALVVALVLVNYIIFASLISVVFNGRRVAPADPTPVPLPTFTPMPSPTAIVLLPTDTPAPTVTPVPLVVETPEEAQPPAETPTPVFAGPYTQVDVTLNVRSGPGTEYDKVGSIPPGSAVEIAGRTADSSWWQIRYPSAPGGLGWVSSDYGTAYKIEEIPLVEAPAPPQPTQAPAPTAAGEPAEATPVPQPEQPQYQFTPDAWYGGEPNAAIGRFYGHLKDAASGVWVNGYSIRATCGDFAVLSFPSGPSPVAPDWEAGWYDIVIPEPVTCNWTLQVVEYQCGGTGFNAQCTQFRPLSEAVPVSTDVEKGETIIVADWTKNW